MGSKQSPSPHSTSSVQVVVRLRPVNDREKKHGTLPVVSASTSDKSVTVIKGQGSRQARSSYVFDNVFTAFSSQEEVFDATLKPIIRDVLQGFESTVFAYGQTGTGKTHTMEGDIDNSEMQGVIPRSAKAIFETLNSRKYQEHSVSCSFLEIYNEDLCDLLVDPSDTNPKLDIMVGKNGPFCRGLSEQQVSSAEHVLDLMRRAQNQRQVGETSMNKQSSRSHCIFTIKIEAKRRLEDGSILEVGGKLHCVDLAGSECAKSADLERGNDSQASRERERKNINQSLLTLGRVVSMLKEQSQSRKKANVRIPYRDSKLTRILQESLGGRCKTCLIATISPSVTAIEESMSTLNYAQAANGIVNKPVTTSFLSSSSAVAIDHHKTSGGGKNEPGAVEHWREMECRLEYMKAQVEEAQQALARKHLQQQDLVEQAEQAHEAQLQAEAQYYEAQEENNGLRQEIKEHVLEKKSLSQELFKTQKTLKETNLILRATQHTESCLAKEAEQLMFALKKSIQDSNDLHQKLLHQRDEEIERKDATKKFNESVVILFDSVSEALNGLASHEEDFGASIADSTKRACVQLIECLEKQQKSIRGLSESIKKTSSAIRSQMEDENGIVGTVQDTAASVRVKTKKATELLRHGEVNMKTSCNRARTNLEASSQHLKQLESRYHETSSGLLENLKTRLSHAKDMLHEMASATTATLEKRKVERLRSSDALQKLVNAWQMSSNSSIYSVVEKGNAQVSEVVETLQMLQAEMARHDEIEKQLSNQRSFLSENEKRHTSDLARQHELLSYQKQNFERAEDRNREFCDQFMSNVMRGVQDLIQDQMEVIAKQRKADYETLASGNEELVRVHSEIQASSQAILSEVASTNHELQQNCEVIRENDAKAARTFQQTAAVFKDIKDSCSNHESLVKSKAQAVSSTIGDIQITDIEAMETLSRDLQNDCQACAAFVVDDIQNEATQGLDELTKSALESSSYVKSDVFDFTQKVVANDIEKPFCSLVKSMKEILEHVAADAQAGDEKIRKLAKDHNRLVDEMVDHVDSSKKQIGEGVIKQSSIISEHKYGLQAAVEDRKRTVLGNVSTMKGLSSNCGKTVSDFTHDVIRPHEETLEIAEMEKIEYSEDLTKTPAADVILRDLRENSVDSSGGLSRSATTIEDKENVVGNAMEVCINDDEHRKVPVLQENKPNTECSRTQEEKKASEPSKRRTRSEKLPRSSLKKPRTNI